MKNKLGWILGGASVVVLAAAVVLVAWLVVKKQPPRDEPVWSSSYLAENQKKADYQRLHQLLSSEEPVRWLFAGDSLTHGCMHTNYRRNYSELFEQYLRSNQSGGLGRSEDTVINTASSGATTRDLSAYFTSWVMQPAAQVAFICFGMNDSGTEDMTPAEFRTHLEQAVSWLRSSGAIPILQTPNDSVRQKRLKPYLEEVRSLAREQELLLIDLNDYWVQNTSVLKKRMADPVHPNDAGHLTWFRFLTASLGMLEPDNQLAHMQYSPSFGSPVKAGRGEPVMLNGQAQSYLGAALTGIEPVTWVFAGGAQTQGLTNQPDERNYIQHFKEVVGWELAADEMGKRCKTMINSGRAGYGPGEILKDYENLVGRYAPDVVSVLTEAWDENGEAVVLAGMERDLRLLIDQVQAQDGKVLLQSPFAYGEQAQAVSAMVQSVAADTGCAFLDYTALLAADLLKQPDLKEALVSEKGILTEKGQLWLGRYLTLSLVQPLANSRIY